MKINKLLSILLISGLALVYTSCGDANFDLVDANSYKTIEEKPEDSADNSDNAAKTEGKDDSKSDTNKDADKDKSDSEKKEDSKNDATKTDDKKSDDKAKTVTKQVIAGYKEKDGNIVLNYELGTLIQIGRYDGITLTKPEDSKVDDAQVVSKAASIAMGFKSISKDKKLVAKENDVVNINFTGYIDGSKKPTKEATGKNYDLGLGSNSFIPGFEKQIVGHKVGESFDVNVTFPDDYHEKKMAGKKALFKVRLNGIVTNDDVKKGTDGKFDTVDAWYKSIKDEIQKDNDKRARETLKREALEKILSTSRVRRFPEDLLEKTKEDYIKYVYEPYANMQGQSLSDFMSQMGITDAKLNEDAQSALASDMAIIAIAKKANINVTVKEFEDKKKDSIGEGKAFKNEEDFINSNGIETLVHNILSNKVEDYLVDHADIVSK